MGFIVGTQGKGTILFVTERMTNVIWVRKLKSKTAVEVNSKLWAMLILYRHMLKTIRTDNCEGFARPQRNNKMLGVRYSLPSLMPRGKMVPSNTLISSFDNRFHKNTDFSNITQRNTDKYILSSMPYLDKNLIANLLREAF